MHGRRWLQFPNNRCSIHGPIFQISAIKTNVLTDRSTGGHRCMNLATSSAAIDLLHSFAWWRTNAYKHYNFHSFFALLKVGTLKLYSRLTVLTSCARGLLYSIVMPVKCRGKLRVYELLCSTKKPLHMQTYRDFFVLFFIFCHFE